MKLFLLLSVCFISTLCEHVRYDDFKVYKIFLGTTIQWSVFQELQYVLPSLDIWNEHKLSSRMDVMVSPEDNEFFLNFLQSNNIEYEVFVENVGRVVEEQLRYIDASTRDGSSFDWTSYHTYDVITAWLDSLAVLYPDSVSGFVLGHTYRGIEIKGVRIAVNPNATRVIVVEGGIHAREWISPATVTYIINEFLTSKDRRVKKVAESYIWYVIPVLNVDGYNKTFTENRLWRKNVQEVTGYTCTTSSGGNTIGTDLNRNFDYNWMQAGGASDYPCDETYAGEYPFSAPEARALKSLIEGVSNRLELFLSFHSYSQVILFPYGYTTQHLGNYDEELAVADVAIEAIYQRYGTVYVAGNTAEILYYATGSSTDWVKGIFGTRFSYCWELRDTGEYGFILPAEQIIPTALETLDGVVAMIEAVN